MINYVKGDLFAAEAQTLAQGCNTLGKMGKGIAAEFKRRYPEMFGEYRSLCLERRLNPGDIYFYRSPDSRPHVLNLMIVRQLDRGELVYVDACFRRIVECYEPWGIKEIAMPRIGCGLARLAWPQVESLLEHYFRNSALHVQIYEK